MDVFHFISSTPDDKPAAAALGIGLLGSGTPSYQFKICVEHIYSVDSVKGRITSTHSLQATTMDRNIGTTYDN